MCAIVCMNCLCSIVERNYANIKAALIFSWVYDFHYYLITKSLYAVDETHFVQFVSISKNHRNQNMQCRKRRIRFCFRILCKCDMINLQLMFTLTISKNISFSHGCSQLTHFVATKSYIRIHLPVSFVEYLQMHLQIFLSFAWADLSWIK